MPGEQPGLASCRYMPPEQAAINSPSSHGSIITKSAATSSPLQASIRTPGSPDVTAIITWPSLRSVP